MDYGKNNANNTWTSTTNGSLNSCSGGCCCGKGKHTQVDNDWSTTKSGDSECGCGSNCKCKK